MIIHNNETLTRGIVAQKGEFVVCINEPKNSTLPITINKSYKVLEVVKAWSDPNLKDIIIEKYYTILNDEGGEGNYLIERFRTKSELRENVINNLLK